MKKLVLGALALAALLAVPAAHAQVDQDSLTLAYAWDMDGEAADADQVIVATALVDNGTSVGGANWTIVAQPDSCRLLDITVVDTDLSVGTLTVTGTGCLLEARTCSFAFTAGDDTGVKTLTCTDGEGAYFGVVSTVTTGDMTGESDETFALGYSATNSANARAMYGRKKAQGPNYEDGVDPFGSYAVALPITTSGASSTTVTSVSTNGAFTNVLAGDLLIFKVGNTAYERKVTARASADSITVNAAVNIPAAGVTFAYKKFWVSTNPADEMWFPTIGYRTLLIPWNVAANTATGGTTNTLECARRGPGWPSTIWMPIGPSTSRGSDGTQNIASAATGAYTDYVDLTLLSFDYCRFSWKFGTGDTAGTEQISYGIVLRK